MRFILLLFALLIATPASAGEWIIDPARSSLSFTGTQGDESFTGRFPAFTAKVDFDPATPETGHIDVTILLATVKVEGDDRQEAILGEDWFDAARFPDARFVSKNIAADGKGGFIATGTLTLKSISQPVILPFTLSEKDGVTHVSGSTILKRNLFKVGTGDFASEEWIAYAVKVDVSLVATPR